MSNNREKYLEILEKYHLWMALLVIVILVGVYFWIGWVVSNEGWYMVRQLLQDVIANLIPVVLVFIILYAFFRHTQTFRSERETGELASRVADMVKSELVTLGEAAKADQTAHFARESLVINSAKYGAKGHYNDVTDRVKSAIAAGKDKVRVDNDIFRPDPIKGEPKTVTVDYIYAGIEGYSKTVPENAYLIFSTLK